MQGRVIDEAAHDLRRRPRTPTASPSTSHPATYTATIASAARHPSSITFQYRRRKQSRSHRAAPWKCDRITANTLRVRLLDRNGAPYPRYGVFVPSRRTAARKTTTLNNLAAGNLHPAAFCKH